MFLETAFLPSFLDGVFNQISKTRPSPREFDFKPSLTGVHGCAARVKVDVIGARVQIKVNLKRGGGDECCRFEGDVECCAV